MTVAAFVPVWLAGYTPGPATTCDFCAHMLAASSTPAAATIDMVLTPR